MRFLSLVILTLSGSLSSAEPYPLWDGKESTAAYAQKANLPPTQSLDLGNGVKLDLALIPAGKFIMGRQLPAGQVIAQTLICVGVGTLIVLLVVKLIRARKNRTRLQFSLAFMLLMTFAASIGVWGGVLEYEARKNSSIYRDESPPHPVTLTTPFYMGIFSVTQEQYQAVIGSNPSGHKGSKDNPVEDVSWDDAQAFCKKLSEQTKQTIQLPTEAEWEYASWAGTTTRPPPYDWIPTTRDAWYAENRKSTNEANTFGLYNMHFIIHQWCQDWYGEDYYQKSVVENPQGPDQGHKRVLRGYHVHFKLSLGRSKEAPGFSANDIGFRVVMRVPPKVP